MKINLKELDQLLSDDDNKQRAVDRKVATKAVAAKKLKQIARDKHRESKGKRNDMA